MTYYVSLAVDTRYHAKVEANSLEDAKNKAVDEFREADIGELECIDITPVNAEDESGNLHDF